jgi:inner membrane protein
MISLSALAPRPGRSWRLAGLALLTLLLTIPLTFVRFVIADRSIYHDIAASDVSQAWGGPVSLTGPFLVVPVQREWTEEATAPDGKVTRKSRKGMTEPLVILPDDLNIDVLVDSIMRSRGIFDIPVYDAAMSLDIGFRAAESATLLGEGETALWDQTRLSLLLPAGRTFKGEAVLKAGGHSLDLEPGTPFAELGGIQAAVGDPRAMSGFELAITLGGAERLGFTPSGHLTHVTVAGNWPDPSFEGRFLPEARSSGSKGFSATWLIPHLSRGVPGAFRGQAGIGGLEAAGFGLRLFDPTSLYALAEKAAKHGLLFIALTFLTVFLIEAARPAHPLHLFLAGMAQVVFFLLLLSLAEQVGFGAAYLAAATATVGLLAWHGYAVLRLGRRNLLFVMALVLLYGALYRVLNSTDHALLTGSFLAFAAVAATMVATRNETWGARS